MATQSLSTFRRFPLLPVELRFQIWFYAIADYPSRLIEIRTHAETSTSEAQGYLDSEGFSKVPWMTKVPNPPFLIACRESRHLTLKSFSVKLKMDRRPRGSERIIYFDSGRDIIFPNLRHHANLPVLLCDLKASSNDPELMINLAINPKCMTGHSADFFRNHFDQVSSPDGGYILMPVDNTLAPKLGLIAVLDNRGAAGLSLDAWNGTESLEDLDITGGEETIEHRFFRARHTIFGQGGKGIEKKMRLVTKESEAAKGHCGHVT